MKFFLLGITVGLNAFFILFSIVYCLARDSSFQYTFVQACLLQLILEILVYETSECIVLNAVIPNMIYSEVQEIIVQLKDLSDNVISQQLSQNDRKFDASNYLFVSKYLARMFPSLFGIVYYCVLFNF